MKNLIFFLLILSSFCLISCGGNDDDATPEEISEFMRVTIDGNSFEAQVVSGTSSSFVGNIITGATPDGETIQVIFDDEDPTGTSIPNDPIFPGPITYTRNTNISLAPYDITGSELILTENDTINNIVAGTFSFEAVNPDNPDDVVIGVDGSFRGEY